MMTAPFFGLNCRILSAFSTVLPRIRSATSLPFCADSLTPRSFAVVSIWIAPLLRRRCRAGFPVCRASRSRFRVAFEHARVGKLAELVTDHVLGDVHGHVLLAVV